MSQSRCRAALVLLAAALGDRISSGSQVTLLEKSEGWCRVVTPASRAGWMTCEALDLRSVR